MLSKLLSGLMVVAFSAACMVQGGWQEPCISEPHA